MNSKQLTKLGVPKDAIPAAVQAISKAAADGSWRGSELKKRIRQVVDNPSAFAGDPYFGEFAARLIEAPALGPSEPVTYQTWGSEIDDAAHHQMRDACSLPVARAAALMPDAHVGYGLPIGGVLACENAVVPYAVGVDIACRMKLSVLDWQPEMLDLRRSELVDAIERGTRFGVGAQYDRPKSHSVMDADWECTRITREHKDKAWKQLGTSGSGNHFVEFGLLTLAEDDEELGLKAGQYVALLSHSGSRGTGAAVCSTYSSIAQSRLPRQYRDLGRLAWLSLDSEAGQEYWAAMNLMGEYAAANHDVIHREVTRLLGAQIVVGVENHHNFAWKEVHGDRELIVHRKGATPAGEGVLGVIPGSMADPGFVVRGLGNEASLMSASHGAGRRMSRKKAADTYRWNAVRKQLEQQGIQVLSAGVDEVPFAYKNIEQVMQEQQDLVAIIARFDPKIVKMSPGGPAED